MRIHIVGKQRQKPHVGDRKTVNGVEYVRVLRPAYERGRIVGHQVSNGLTLFDWVKVTPNNATRGMGDAD